MLEWMAVVPDTPPSSRYANRQQFNELFNLNIWGKSAQQLPLTAFLWPLCQVEDGGKQMFMLEHGAICDLTENPF